MTKNIKIAVVLSGCGVFDGSEIHEAVMTLLAIDKQNAIYQCFAPDINQSFVKNHFSGQKDNNPRNVLAESGRIARGSILPIKDYSADNFDGIIFPGGFGAVTNLCDFANKGADCFVNHEIEQAVKETFNAKKPIGGLCIAPALIAKILGGHNVKVTIGNDKQTIAEIEKTGAKHEICSATQVCIDDKNKIITCPCYMLAKSISEIEEGAKKTVAEIIKMVVDKKP